MSDLGIVGVGLRNGGRGVGPCDVGLLRSDPVSSFLLLNEECEHEVGLDRVVGARTARGRLAGEQGGDQRDLVRVRHLLENKQSGFIE